MSALHCVVYVSAATRLFPQVELERLLADARAQNRQAQVTGILLYADGNFMQLLEGSEAALDAVMQRVRRSRRHSGIMTLLREPIAQREFGDWDMAFRRIERADFLSLTTGTSKPHILLRSFLENVG